MDSDDWKRLGITADTKDPLDLSLALAARGVLAGAAAGDGLLNQPRRWRAALNTALDRHGFVPLLLRDSREPPPDDGICSAAALAGVWRDCVAGQVAKHPPVRIAIRPAGSDPSCLASAARITLPLMYARPPYGNGSIGSVITEAELAPRRLDRWPVRIGILPGESARGLERALAAVPLAQSGLVDIGILTPGEPGCDILLAPCRLHQVRSRASSRGIIPAGPAVLVTYPDPATGGQRMPLLQRIQAALGVGVVITGMPMGAEARWIDALVTSLSHRTMLDLAVWEADRSVRAMGRKDSAGALPPPMIFAHPDSLLEPPINLQISALRQRLGYLHYLGRSQISRGELDETESVLIALKTTADSLNYLHFHSETEGATQVAEVARMTDALESAASGADPRPALYGDVTFFDARSGVRVDDRSEPLVRGKDYQLEVALRQRPRGVSSRRGATLPTAPLPPGKEIELLVVVLACEGDFKVAQPTQSLRLPPDVAADSDAVRFSIRPLRATPDMTQLCCVEVKIYFEFNLIESLVVRAAVQAEFDELPEALHGSIPITIDQRERVDRGYRDMDRWQVARHMGIDIRREGDVARFTFTARTGPAAGGQAVVLPGQLDVPLTILVPLLNKMRGLWEDIAVNMIGATLQPAEHVFHQALMQLAQVGRELWSLLFKGAMGSSMYVIGEWLSSHPAPDGAVIDVRLLEGSAAFAFPWSLLYDRELPPGAATADPAGFWGVRYAIGQSTSLGYHDDAPIAPKPSKLAFMLWDAFPNRDDQIQLLKQIEADSGSRLQLEPTITTRSAFYEMVKNCDADILYFYTHGHTHPASAYNDYDPVQSIRAHLQQLSAEQRAATGLEPLYQMIAAPDFRPDESWIMLSSGRLKLKELRDGTMNLRRAPVVFLNMCQSAQVMPGLADSFVSLFLDRRARSVLGTECPMTTVFAHPFSERLLREFFAGKTLGESLRLARCHFMQQKNPLGLAYTLFGAATARYEPALLDG